MLQRTHALRRRTLLAGVASSLATPLLAQPGRAPGRPVTIAQVAGVEAIGAVFASEAEHRLYREELARIARTLRLQNFHGDDFPALARKLPVQAPAVLLFIGGTPELVQFSQGLQERHAHRYLVALADVNLQTVQQMAGARSSGLPMITTQSSRW